MDSKGGESKGKNYRDKVHDMMWETVAHSAALSQTIQKGVNIALLAWEQYQPVISSISSMRRNSSIVPVKNSQRLKAKPAVSHTINTLPSYSFASTAYSKLRGVTTLLFKNSWREAYQLPILITCCTFFDWHAHLTLYDICTSRKNAVQICYILVPFHWIPTYSISQSNRTG
jgi:hypothetical protein